MSANQFESMEVHADWKFSNWLKTSGSGRTTPTHPQESLRKGFKQLKSIVMENYNFNCNARKRQIMVDLTQRLSFGLDCCFGIGGKLLQRTMVAVALIPLTAVALLNSTSFLFASGQVPEISISAPVTSVVEGEKGTTTTVEFLVHANIRPTGSLAVNYTPEIVNNGWNDRFLLGLESGSMQSAELNFVENTGGTGFLSLLSVSFLGDDLLWGNDGEMRVTLNGDSNNPATYTVAASPDNRATVTVLEDDKDIGFGVGTVFNNPELSILTSSGKVQEGKPVVFKLTGPASSTETDVNIKLTSISNDVERTFNRTVKIPAGKYGLSISIEATDDALSDTTTSISAKILPGSGYYVDEDCDEATVIITKEPPLPELSISAVSNTITEGEVAAFRLVSVVPTEETMAVNAAYTHIGNFLSTLSAGTANPIVVSLNGLEAKWAINTMDNAVAEKDGSITVSLLNGQGYIVDESSGSASVTVMDNDPPEISISATSASVPEGGPSDPTTVEFNIHANLQPPGPLTVRYTPAITHGRYGIRSGRVQTAVLNFVEHSGGYLSRLSVPLNGDTAVNADQTLQVTLNADSSSPPAYTVAASPDNRATVTIREDDFPKDPEISISPVSNTVSEGEPAQFRLTASPASISARSFNIRLTTSINHQELHSNRPVTIPAGETSKVFSVATPDDNEVGTIISVSATILAGENTGFNEHVATVTVMDDDTVPVPSVSVSTVTESVTEGDWIWFLISANRKSVDRKSVNVTVSESNGSFLGTDVPESAELWAGYRMVYLRVPTVDDRIDETDGNITVTLGTGTGYTVNSAESSASATVEDNDVAMPVASIASMDGGAIAEGSSADFNISTNIGTPSDTDIRIRTTQNGNYVSGEIVRTVRIAERGNSVLLSIPTIDDEIDEPDGSITVEILEGEGYTVASVPNSVASVAVTDNDLPPADPMLSIADGSTVMEGGIVEISISAETAIESDLAISVQIEENGESSRRILHMDAGELIVILPITTMDDEVFKGESLIRVTLLSGNGYQVDSENSTALVTVLENETEPEISVEAISATVTEGTSIWFLLKSSRASDTGQTISVGIGESIGSYLHHQAPESVEIQPYHRYAIIGLETSDDRVAEGDGSVDVTIRDGDGYAVAGEGHTASVKVLDNDQTGSVPIVSTSSIMSSMEEGGIAIFRVHASSNPLFDITVNLIVTEAGEFISGDTISEVEISKYNSIGLVLVRTEDDDVAESDGSVTLEILEGYGYDIVSGPGTRSTVEVSDNDSSSKAPDMAISATATSIAEGNDAEFVLQSLSSLNIDISVRVNVVSSGEFFDQGTDGVRKIELKAGTDSKLFSIPTIGDNLEEPDGSITITIENDDNSPATYDVSETNFSVSVNITDDDDRPLISIESVDSTLEESAGFAEFIITSNRALQYDLTVSVDVRETGNVISGNVPTTARFVAGQASVDLQIPLTDDSTVEEVSRITVTLVQGGGYAIAPSSRAYVDVEDNDADSAASRVVPTASISRVSSEIEEGGTAEFVIRLDSDAKTELEVKVAWTVEGDYLNAGTGTVKVPEDGREGKLSLVSKGDDEIKADGSVTAIVKPGEGYDLDLEDLESISATITILDNDESPSSGRSEALHRSVLPDLLAATSEQTVNAVSSRIDFAFNNAGQGRFELAGTSSVEEIVKLSGQFINEGDVELTRVLSGSNFTLPIMSEGDSSSIATLWGSGFSRDLLDENTDSSVDWNGESFSGLLGFDARFGSGLLFGMAASSNDSSVDFRLDDREGVLKGAYQVRLTSLQPYFGWSNDDLSTRLRASAGYGLGEVEIEYGNHDPEVAESRQYSMLLGGTERLYSSESLFGGSSELTLNAEAWTVRQFVEGNGKAIAGTSVGTRSLRINAEGALEKQLESGSVFNPTLSIGTRWDGGDDRQGLGLEFTGGAEFENPMGLSVSGNGRMLITDGSTSNERGLKAELNYDHGRDGIGLFANFSPAWGKLDGRGIQQLWDGDVEGSDSVQNSDGVRLASEIGYGIGILAHGMIFSPFANTELKEGGRNSYGIGSRLASDSNLRFELEGSLDSTSVGTANQKVRFEGSLEW